MIVLRSGPRVSCSWKSRRGGGGAFLPDQTLHDLEYGVCDYCNANAATIELEGAFVVDGMSIGWYSNDWDAQLNCG